MRIFIICTLHQILSRVIKSRRIIWAGHVARMEVMRSTYKILVGKPKGKIHLRDLGVDGRIMLKRVLKKQNVRMQTGFSYLRQGPVAGCREQSWTSVFNKRWGIS
jgi:hypothetical protein